MRIGELSRATGVDAQTIRYYEREGLLSRPLRQPNGYRRYGAEQLEQLTFIRHCRSLDMGLAEVKRLLEFHSRPAGDCSDIDHLVEEQLARVRARIDSLRALERQLAMLSASCGKREPRGECGILHELVAPAHGEACACHREG